MLPSVFICLFIIENVKVIKSWILGKAHKKMLLSSARGNSKVFNAIQFNIDMNTPIQKSFDYIIFSLAFNRWNGSKTIQLEIKDFL